MAALAPSNGSTQVVVTGTTDALFKAIEKMHTTYRPPEAGVSMASWGSVLDAGTGAHSLEWIRRLPATGWCAVTADAEMQRTVEAELAKPLKPLTPAGGDGGDGMEVDAPAGVLGECCVPLPEREGSGDARASTRSIVLGNWDDPALLQGSKYV